MAFPTPRPLVTGGGTVATGAVGSRVLTFTSPQGFKTGASVVVDSSSAPQYFTIDQGSGTVWNARQPCTATVTGRPFLRTNETTLSSGRARGGANTYLIPDAPHFIYVSDADDTGAPDVKYTYADTLAPENGKHPYLRDLVSNSGMSARNAQAIIPDLGTRVRRLEGIFRFASTGPTGSIVDPQMALNNMKLRLYNIERALLGLSTAPAVGSSGTQPSAETLVNLGDAV